MKKNKSNNQSKTQNDTSFGKGGELFEQDSNGLDDDGFDNDSDGYGGDRDCFGDW